MYLKALDFYRIEREDRAGIGYVDFIFYPFVKNDDCIIIELKVNHTAAEAIRQIKDRPKRSVDSSEKIQSIRGAFLR